MIEILDAFDWASLAPDGFGAIGGVLRGCMQAFLGALPPARLVELADAQRRLSIDAPASERQLAVLQSCPTLHKFGQLLARRRELDAAIRAALQKLESLPP